MKLTKKMARKNHLARAGRDEKRDHAERFDEEIRGEILDALRGGYTDGR